VVTGPAPITQVAGSAGVAAGIEYLAGCSASDEDQVAAYHQAEPPSEKKGKKDILNWDLLEQALAFFEELPQMEQVREVMIDLLPAMEGDLKVSQAVKTAVIIKAWNHHCKEDLAFTAEDITPETVVDGFGNRILAESPTLGGIDDGDRLFKKPKKHDAEDSSDTNAGEGEDEFPPDASDEEEDSDEENNGVAGMTAPDLTEEELERRKDEQLAAREEKRQQLAENRKERQRTRRRDDMAQSVARATARTGEDSSSQSE
jgi:hypothetical protein